MLTEVMERFGLLLAGGLYLLIVNGWTAFAFWWDKQRAGAGGWRMPESRLLWLAALGGSGGAKFAQARFRHKTRKEPFRSQLNGIIVGQVVLLVLGLGLLAVPGGVGQLSGMVETGRTADPAQEPEVISINRPSLLGSVKPLANPARLIGGD